jgi:hypothetical protein
MRFRFFALAVPVLLAAQPAAVQAPRGADGKPDFTGLWQTPHVEDLARDNESAIPYTAAGRAAWKNTDLKNDPLFACLYPGVPRIMGTGDPVQIVQTPGLIVMLFELMHLWRTIPLDGRPHPNRMEPALLGDSNGKWDGDTLVIDTVSLRGAPWTWLDRAGHQHTDALHVTERLQRTAAGILYQATMDDPTMYARPWVAPEVLLKPLQPTPGYGDLMEYACNENNRDLQHLVSTKTVDPGWDFSRPRRAFRQNGAALTAIALASMAVLAGGMLWLRRKRRR